MFWRERRFSFGVGMVSCAWPSWPRKSRSPAALSPLPLLAALSSPLAFFLDLRPVLAVANVFTLTWYSIVLCDALMLPKAKRLVWPVVSWFGLAGCLALFASLPGWSLLIGSGGLALLVGIRWLVFRY